ncbi:MAG: endo alpha-1,4 polygalactosaminidase [Actinobacteria bacterium]|nr:endo alpha-1,4 polygalactosaminidase [Actinomycetota bacterium]
MTRWLAAMVSILLGMVVLTGAGPTRTTAVWQPARTTTWQWQITGRVHESVKAQMFDIDLFDARPGEINAGIVGRLHARRVKVVCYVDTGAWESYRPDAHLFPRSVIGNGTGWDGERWLDIRHAAWPKFAHLVWRRLHLAKRHGCDGVEPDQNNPFGNKPGFPITLADQKAWYLEVARQAHVRGLSVGMKNGIETVDAQTVAAFDWALNEECFEYDECDVMKPFIAAGKALFQVEYGGDPAVFCPKARRLGSMTMKKRRALNAWRITCWRRG